MKDILSQDLSKYRVLVVGDSILDKYYYGEVNRISPEAPVPINHIIDIKNKLGGAANVANALSTLGLSFSIAWYASSSRLQVNVIGRVREEWSA